MPTFLRSGDQEFYLDLLSSRARRYGMSVLSFCLMNNHVHLVVVPQSENAISEAIGETHQLYAQKVNVREGWSGHFWQARFYSDPLGPRAAYLVMRYVLMNPVRAGLVERPEDWVYSSARQHLGIVPVSPLLSTDLADRLIGDWSELLSRDVEPETLRRIRRTTRRGRLFLAACCREASSRMAPA
jgi:putative transposase